MYNATCLVTGVQEKLRMHALRNDKGEMIGWIFLSKNVNIDKIDATVEWKFKVQIEK
jgi:hypothetical protein